MTAVTEKSQNNKVNPVFTINFFSTTKMTRFYIFFLLKFLLIYRFETKFKVESFSRILVVFLRNFYVSFLTLMGFSVFGDENNF